MAITIRREDLAKLAELAAFNKLDTSALSYSEAQLVLAYHALIEWQREMFDLEPILELAPELAKPLITYNNKEADDDNDE